MLHLDNPYQTPEAQSDAPPRSSRLEGMRAGLRISLTGLVLFVFFAFMTGASCSVMLWNGPVTIGPTSSWGPSLACILLAVPLAGWITARSHAHRWFASVFWLSLPWLVLFYLVVPIVGEYSSSSPAAAVFPGVVVVASAALGVAAARVTSRFRSVAPGPPDEL